MSDPSVAAINLLTEMLKNIQEDVRGVRDELATERRSASESRKGVFEKLDAVRSTLDDHGNRLLKVEEAIESEQPTWQEYRENRLRIQGAGWLGTALWKVGRWLIFAAFFVAGWAYSARDQLSAVWHKLWS